MKNRKNIIIIIFIGIFIICIVIIKGKFSNNNYDTILTNTLNSNSNDSEMAVDIDNDFIKVHIYGEVNNPGLIELEVGSRVADAIEMAGGTTENVDMSKVNLAYILSDGEKVYIPNINDTEDVVSEDSIQNNSKININTATSTQLATLNGIGESLAESIIEYRNENGRFKDIEDIKNVSGIGDNKFEKIKDYICVK
jgi:competence protein ComEA